MLFIHKEARTVLVLCAAPSWWFMHRNMFCLINVVLAPQTDCVTSAVTKIDKVTLRQVTAAGVSSLGICWVGDLGAESRDGILQCLSKGTFPWAHLDK